MKRLLVIAMISMFGFALGCGPKPVADQVDVAPEATDAAVEDVEAPVVDEAPVTDEAPVDAPVEEGTDAAE